MFLPNVKKYTLLAPFSWLYSLGVWWRNRMFDKGYKKSVSFEEKVAVICVGNLTVGGTGKTPHTEYLVKLFNEHGISPIAVLSHGYKRSSKGFLMASDQIPSAKLGDESYQIHRKFPNLIVAVDEKRVHGIKKLLELPNPPKVIILDDAMQHRYVKAGLNICLTSYNRIIYKDSLLPVGLLREPMSGINRADLLLVTKCPKVLRSEEETEINGNIPVTTQPILYSTYRYSLPVNLYTGQPTKVDATSQVLIVAGIADPTILENYVQTHFRLLDVMRFSDHHRFVTKDIKEIQTRLDNVNISGYCTNDSGNQSIIITTEKDASRLVDNPSVSTDLKKRIYYLPTEVFFLQNHKEKFDKIVLDYVNKSRGL